jgi:amino acid adenylation domain-containing protein
VRQLLAGGDVLSPEAVRRALELLPGCRVINGYGPTESTTFTCCHGMDAPGEVGRTVPIGRPIAGTEVYLLDGEGEWVPVGVPGELWIGGAGLGRGYFGRPDLTADRWRPDDASGETGARLYRTGDLARWRDDGTLEFLGRSDDQVKIRGFRIEPGEVESVLSTHPGVREVSVGVLGEGVRRHLAAYVVGDAERETLQPWLRERLPEYMVPSRWLTLESLPLTANGKVDRDALARWAESVEAPPASGETGAPRTPLEELLAVVWSELLGVEQVGVTESFFDLGGHSLLATQLVSRLRSLVGLEVPLRALFEHPTVAELAGWLEEQRRGEQPPAPPLVPVPREAREGDLPLSFAQERLWFLDQLAPGNPVYNLPLAIRLRGALHVPALAHSLGEVVARHESLRTVFAVAGSMPVQRITAPGRFSLPVVDLAALPAAVRERELRRLLQNEAMSSFDLSRGPLLRARIFFTGSEEGVFHLNVHHIVADGWSLGVLVREVGPLYESFLAGHPAPLAVLAALPIQYPDYSVWQRRHLDSALEPLLAWWQEQLGGELPILDLPVDRPRPPVQTWRSGTLTRWLSPDLTASLHGMARREGATLFMVLLAGFTALLSRLSGQEDVLVGTPIAGRDREETEDLIGCFLNTLVLRTDLSGDPAFRELLARVREVCLGAYAHQELPFERLLQLLSPERDLSRTPLFQVFFNLLNFPKEPVELPGLTLLPEASPEALSKFDLTVYASAESQGIALSLVYNADLFDAARIEGMLDQYELVLSGALAALERPLREISLVTAAAAALLPDPGAELSAAWEGAAHDLFSAWARRTPDALAVADPAEQWTYRELDERSDRLAAFLRAGGVAPGAVVALWAHRSAPLVWGVLGVLKAGAAFVMLDPRYPAPRQVEMLRVARPAAWLQVERAGPVPAAIEGELEASGCPCRLMLSARSGDRSLLDAFSPEPSGVMVGPDDPAYVAFTSGSTGAPKGVLGRHGSLSHFMPWLSRRFGLSASDRFSLLSGLAHDPLHRDLFTPLQLGAAVVIPDPERMDEPGALAAWMRDAEVSVAHLTPALGQLLTSAAETGPAVSVPSLRYAFLVGDVLTRRDVARLRCLAPQVTCVNYYGSTETQRAVGYHVAEGSGEDGEAAQVKEVLPLGRGIPDVQLLVLNSAGALSGVGELGEISVRSPHLALGYLGDPQLTAQRFGVNPFTGRRDDRLYRTGDLGRYLPDGTAVFVGRADTQVKIRGFRVELGEIEAVLGRFPGVREAVVIVRQEGGAERYLAAYVVAAPGSAPDPREMRSFLRGKLPDYMVPAAFVLLGELPLTPNRKVDRRALPAPDRGRGDAAFVPPEGPVEELLAGLWSELLGVSQVGAGAGFFDLGGHSLLAARLLARVRALLGIDLPLRRIFELPTLRDLAREIAALRAAGAETAAPPLVPAARSAALPLSFAQERLWFLDQLAPGSAAYNLAAAVRLTGRLEVAALAAALTALVRRHEVLRTVYVPTGTGGAEQEIAPAAPASLPLVDLTALPEGCREAATRLLSRQEASRPFDLAIGPVLRITLLCEAADEHVALLTFHHIAADGWSLEIFVRELAVLYGAACTGRPSPLPALAVQYADFAIWQRGWLSGDVLAGQVEHWRRTLAGAPELLDLPADRPRPAVQSSRGAQRALSLAQPLAAALQDLGRLHGATLFMVLAAGWGALLHRLAGRDDISVGTPVANRSRPEIEGLLGLFANTLVLRVDLAGDPTFAGLAARVREACLEAFGHQDVPFEKLVEELSPQRSLSHAPLFQVLFALQNTPVTAFEAPALRLTPLQVETGTAKLDLSLSLVPGPSGLTGRLEYLCDLFDAVTIERLGAHFRSLLTAATRCPEARLSDLPLLSEAERHQVREWNDTASALPVGLSPQGWTIHGLVELQAARTPEAIAVEDLSGARLTYAELDARADRLARRLAGLGVGPEILVGVALDRSVGLLVGLLAVLKAGGGYVPLDPGFPPDRLALMVADSGLRVLLTEERLLPRLPGSAAVVAVDRGGEVVVAGPELGLPDAVLPAGIAYVIYTSGSTGRPKGVQVLHGAVVSFLLSMARRPGLGATDAVLAVTTLSFDIAVLELFLPLVTGGRVVLASREVASDGERLGAALARPEITVLQATPATWRMLFAAGWPGKPALKALCGGEALPRDLADRLLGAVGELWNVYGPTETTIWSTTGPVEERGGPVSIGRPLANTRILLLSGAVEPVPAGVAGELCIGGLGLARGYLGRPDLTAERFVPDPRTGADGEAGGRLYRTGDLARWHADGRLECLGRIDAQVKVRGFRIEPGEIEVALGEHPAIRQAAVVARRHDGGDHRLVAYVVVTGEAPASAELRDFLAARLPDYMVPGAFLRLDALPLTPNGKVDRRALPEPQAAATAYVAPRSPVEQLLADIWREVLDVESVGVQDDFFDLGGHSLLALQVITRIRRTFDLDIELRHIFRFPTIGQLSEALLERPDLRDRIEAIAALTVEVSSLSEEELDAMLQDEVV